MASKKYIRHHMGTIGDKHVLQELLEATGFIYCDGNHRSMLIAAGQDSTNDHGPLSYLIIEAIAEKEGVDPINIEPPQYDALYEVLNPEALDALFAPREDGTPRNAGHVTFTFCGYEIKVSSDRTVSIID